MTVVAKPTGRPVIPRAVDNDPENVIIRRDADRPEAKAAALIALEEFDMGRLKAGYVCVNCLEDLDTAYPDACPVCRYPMATKQAERVAKEFVGDVKIGPSTTLEDERLIMQEMRERRRVANHGIEVYSPQIIVPRGV